MTMEFDASRLNTQPGKALKDAVGVLSKSQNRSKFVEKMAKAGGATPAEKERGDQAKKEERAGQAADLAALKKKRDAAISDLKTKRRVVATEGGRIARARAAATISGELYANKAKTDVKKARSLARIKANSSVGKPPAKKP